MPFSGVGFFLFTYGSVRHLVGLLGRGISPAPRPLPTQVNTTQRNADTSMPREGFEPAIPMFERPKRVLGLDRAAIETGVRKKHGDKFTFYFCLLPLQCYPPFYACLQSSFFHRALQPKLRVDIFFP
jgi:hypothetical protein